MNGQVNKEPSILIWDVETSPNITYTWAVGRKVSIPDSFIIKERDVICICWKWVGEDEVHSLDWSSRQNSKPMLKKFLKEINQADLAVAHNGDNFDIKVINTQLLLHDLPGLPEVATDDTLKQIRKAFKFNANNLNYISKLLGFRGKHKMNMDDWKNVMDKVPGALEKMVDYCKRDVLELESVYLKLKPYIKSKVNKAVMANKPVCPSCGEAELIKNGTRAVNMTKYQRYHCRACGAHSKATLSKVNNREGQIR